jgi:L-rhamnose-H+ transport protein
MVSIENKRTASPCPGVEKSAITIYTSDPSEVYGGIVSETKLNTGSGSNWIEAVALHWTGGLASASFYLPFRFVRKWNWETYWLVGGFFSWIIAPIFFAWLLVPDFWHVISGAGGKVLIWTYIFGVLWGMGGLTFGLTLRYLGIGLGMAIALSYCAAFGTLVPPIFAGKLMTLLTQHWGQVILLGVLVCLAGIAVSGWAGWSKEQELPPEQKQKVVKEFNFKKGILVATFSGIMSACFNYGLTAATPIVKASKTLLITHHAMPIWDGLPSLVVLLWGGFTTNFVWCLILHFKNKSGGQYVAPVVGAEADRIVTGLDGPGYTATPDVVGNVQPKRVPLLGNYVFSAAAGVIWYFQFFFYTMGQTKMPKAGKFSGWTLHMASIIIFATLWGVVLHEWKGTSKKTHWIITAGVATLVLSTLIVGAGNYLKQKEKAPPVKTAHVAAVIAHHA